jgi:hypothetical protein
LVKQAIAIEFSDDSPCSAIIAVKLGKPFRFFRVFRSHNRYSSAA